MMPEVILPPRVYSREPAYPLWAHADAVPPAGAGEGAPPPSNPAKSKRHERQGKP